MATSIAKSAFLADLRERIGQHCATVTATFLSLDQQRLEWRPRRGEWNVLQCFDHLNLTHEYYAPRIARALACPEAAGRDRDSYSPSFWARIYMHFAFNPRYSFPTAAAITPGATISRDALTVYLAKQEALLRVLDTIQGVDLAKTPVPIEKGVRFNLGDCLKVLVYHDALHIGQAQGVLAAYAQARHLAEIRD